jgi:branched-chain amino acid transport system permease protein
VQEILGAVTLGSIYLLFALGMSVTWGTIDILNFSHGSIFMFSVFVSYVMLQHGEQPFLVVCLIGIVAGATLSLVIQLVAFDQILRRSTDKRTAEMQILIGGIGVAGVPLVIAQNYTKSNPFGLRNSSFHVDSWELFGLRITNVAAVTIVVSLLIWGAVALWLRRSRHGLALRAIGVDSETAALMGVDRRRLALYAMAFSGALAGLAGILFTFGLGAITPESGDTLLLKAFACIVLGGVGSMAGIAFGAFFLAFAETVLLTQTSGSWADAVSFGLIFAVLLLRPAGVFGRKEVRRA